MSRSSADGRAALPPTSMRSPYGGLTIRVPGRPCGSSGAGRSSASPPLNTMAASTPARCALRRAKSTIRNDTSLAKIGTALAWMRVCAWLFRRCHCARISAPSNGNRRSNANRRFRPGAMPQAICAASMAMVPEPQHGSCKAPPASGVPRQPAAASMAAARVSFSGASPTSSRQPRLKSDSPDVSTYSAARSAPTCSTSCRSGRWVSTLGRSPVASRSMSHTASLMRSAAKFRLFKGLRCAVVSTRSVCRGVIHCAQSTARARS